MATDDLKARLAKEIARLRDVRGDYLDLAPPDPLLTEAADYIATLEAQLAARDVVIELAGELSGALVLAWNYRASESIAEFWQRVPYANELTRAIHAHHEAINRKDEA